MRAPILFQTGPMSVNNSVQPSVPDRPAVRGLSDSIGSCADAGEHSSGPLRACGRVACDRAGGGAVLHRVRRGHAARSRRFHAAEFHGCLHVASPWRIVFHDDDLRRRDRGAHLPHGRLHRVGRGAHGCAGPRVVSPDGAADVRNPGTSDDHVVDTDRQPEYRLAEQDSSGRVRPVVRAAQHLHDGRHDLGSFEPLLSRSPIC